MSNKFLCDSQRCLTFKTTCICYHIVGVARLTDQLDSFLEWYKRSNQSVNFTSLAQTGISVGGKKPKKRKGISKNDSTKISRMIENSKEDEWTDKSSVASLHKVNLSSSHGSNCFLSIQSQNPVTSLSSSVHLPMPAGHAALVDQTSSSSSG